MKIKCKDFKGNEYKSKTEMCDAYGIALTTFLRRARQNWTLKECLCGKTSSSHGKACEGLDGEPYTSLTDRCKAYNVPYTIYKGRIARGWTLEQALTIPVDASDRQYASCLKGDTDYKDERFFSTQAMCDFYGIGRSTYMERLNHNWSKERALTTPVRKYADKKVTLNGSI